VEAHRVEERRNAPMEDIFELQDADGNNGNNGNNA
jgi:hypothetical protein